MKKVIIIAVMLIGGAWNVRADDAAQTPREKIMTILGYIENGTWDVRRVKQPMFDKYVAKYAPDLQEQARVIINKKLYPEVAAQEVQSPSRVQQIKSWLSRKKAEGSAYLSRYQKELIAGAAVLGTAALGTYVYKKKYEQDVQQAIRLFQDYDMDALEREVQLEALRRKNPQAVETAEALIITGKVPGKPLPTIADWYMEQVEQTNAERRQRELRN